MGLNFRKSIKIAKGVSVNVGTGGVSVSLRGKKKGIGYSLNSSGRASVSLPGTGLSYSTNLKTAAKKVDKKFREYKSDAYKKQEKLGKDKAALEKEKAALAKKQAAEEQAQAKEQAKQTALAENRLRVEEYENYIERIKGVHKECDETVDWTKVRDAQPPFSKNETGPAEKEALAALESFKPGVMGKLFGQDDKRRAELQKAVEEAKAADAEEFEAWQESVKFAGRILAGDVDAYLEVLEEANPFEDFADYGSDLEFGTDSGEYMEIEFRVKSREVVPENALSLTSTGKLSEKAASKTTYYDLTQDYVCSCAIRLAREIFAVLPVQAVLVHAVDGVLNTATGNDTEETILSVGFTREGFEGINFDRIDPSDFLSTFPMRMQFSKTAGFKPVERIAVEA
jgi:Skp family chaperone for outer membrane proteins